MPCCLYVRFTPYAYQRSNPTALSDVKSLFFDKSEFIKSKKDGKDQETIKTPFNYRNAKIYIICCVSLFPRYIYLINNAILFLFHSRIYLSAIYLMMDSSLSVPYSWR